ncbi:MAG: aminotransferase class V-fold PLP-dependent enzyme [Actinomycetota bacterium]
MSRGVLVGSPTLSPAALSTRRHRQLPYPLQDQSLTLSARGRHSLHLGLKALGVGAGDEVLVPAYHHGSEIEAIAQSGATCRFYGGTSRLEPDPDELEGLLGPQVRALHLTHYIGFPQDCERWRRWCSERGLLLFEDAAQAWLSTHGGRPLGTAGDLAIFCLYKSVGVPDGGALVCRSPARVEQKAPAGGFVMAAKRAVLWAAQHRLVPARIVMRNQGAGSFDAAAGFAVGDVESPPSRATSLLLPRLNYARVPERRRRNYLRLLAALGRRVPPPFEALPEGASPMIFPVRAEDKAGFLEHLRHGGIKAVDFWSVSHPAFDDDWFPAIAERRATTVGLPVHQELSDADIDQVVEAATSWSD